MASSPKSKASTHDKITFREFLSVSKWTLGLLIDINPFNARMFMLSEVVRGITPLLNTYVVAKVIDLVLDAAQQEGSSMQDLIPYLAMILVVNLIENILGFISLYTRRSMDYEARPGLKRILYKKLHTLGIQTLESPEVNNKIHRAKNEIYGIINFNQNLVRLVSTVIAFMTAALLMLKYAPIVIPVILLIAVPRWLNDKKYRRLVWKFGYDSTEGNRKASWSASDLASPKELQEIIISNAIAFLDKKFTKYMNWYVKKSIAIRRKWFIYIHTFSFLDDITIAFGYLVIFSKLLTKTASIGDVVFQLRVIDRFSRDLNRLSTDYNNAIEFAIRLKDTYVLFNTEPEVADGTTELETMEVGPEIVVEDLSFTYPRSEKRVMHNLNLHIKPREKIAIVGHNGAGKTTLVKLLCRMYTPDSGSIKINGEDLKDIKIDTWYQNIGVLFQDYNTYPQLTAKENILIGKPNIKPDEDAIEEAAKNADTLKFIKDFPDGFAQTLSEKFKGGIRPSTGQWQKIAIARFFYRNAPLVVFDEPTASIDAVSEYKIFNRIYSFFKNKTVIIISHRFSTVRNADRIIVIEKGKIIEEGTHEELLKMDGYYAKSFKLQAEGYTIAPTANN